MSLSLVGPDLLLFSHEYLNENAGAQLRKPENKRKDGLLLDQDQDVFANAPFVASNTASGI